MERLNVEGMLAHLSLESPSDYTMLCEGAGGEVTRTTKRHPPVPEPMLRLS